eukprot:CAMPEP_0194041960 /NCGR_PEP_ID=MMETSP0009_2-20130614/13764_1 /TAXON_ID=210454 /ORGANISM="Grammatophora oceanica, Strain CCMP 410" /LENGTH=652 /DNA_ID=CAMNT_0038685615 /DNA_START=97 /DNA_END=2055 /DNA_ORIENTATION=+
MMSGELTLTGGTLTSDGGAGGMGSLEMAPVASHKHDPLSGGSHGHSHGHNGHDHSHGHTNEKACCSSHASPPKTSLIIVPAADDLLQKSPQEIFETLVFLVRQATFLPFENLLQNLKGKNLNLIQDVLNSLGQEGHSLIHWAAKRADDIRFLQLLCGEVKNETINIQSQDKVGMRPLHWCSTEGSVPHAWCLIQHGANLEAEDSSGCTPLLIAAQYGHVELVAFLLQKGANGAALDSSRDSALHWAAYKGSIQVCGLLLWRGELHWTTADAYGQATLHLASLRGHTTVVRYLLQEGTRAERRKLLFMKDKNGKTPLDLAITKKRPNVAAVLREAMADFDNNGQIQRFIKKTIRQFCSIHSWRTWIGCVTPGMDEMDEPPRFVYYWVVLNLFLHIPFYPLCFTPLNAGTGYLWDKMTFHLLNFIVISLTWFAFYKTTTTNPGLLDESSPKTPELRRLYEQTLESYSDPDTKMDTPLCHTCHIAKPLRSKHCRMARRCVLMFDHYCPFVGNTVGLYNYKWFYMFLFFMTLEELGFAVTCFLYVRRVYAAGDHVQTFFFVSAGYLFLYILMSGGLLIYHTQLSIVNLTTNEQVNMFRLKYLRNRDGLFRNPFNRGPIDNVTSRLFPSEHCYVLPQDHEALMGHRQKASASGMELV